MPFGVRIGQAKLASPILHRSCDWCAPYYSHHVDEDEVVEVLEQPGEDRAAREGSRIALGQTASGRYLRVIYVPDNDPESVFVIAAFDLTGKPLAAYRLRRRRKHQ